MGRDPQNYRKNVMILYVPKYYTRLIKKTDKKQDHLNLNLQNISFEFPDSTYGHSNSQD
jgi:hypothetical protein